jgi:hypothetical protein
MECLQYHVCVSCHKFSMRMGRSGRGVVSVIDSKNQCYVVHIHDSQEAVGPNSLSHISHPPSGAQNINGCRNGVCHVDLLYAS